MSLDVSNQLNIIEFWVAPLLAQLKSIETPFGFPITDTTKASIEVLLGTRLLQLGLVIGIGHAPWPIDQLLSSCWVAWENVVAFVFFVIVRFIFA